MCYVTSDTARSFRAVAYYAAHSEQSVSEGSHRLTCKGERKTHLDVLWLSYPPDGLVDDEASDEPEGEYGGERAEDLNTVVAGGGARARGAELTRWEMRRGQIRSGGRETRKLESLAGLAAEAASAYYWVTREARLPVESERGQASGSVMQLRLRRLRFIGDCSVLTRNCGCGQTCGRQL